MTGRVGLVDGCLMLTFGISLFIGLLWGIERLHAWVWARRTTRR